VFAEKRKERGLGVGGGGKYRKTAQTVVTNIKRSPSQANTRDSIGESGTP